MEKDETRYTPATIAESKLIFNIPLYQRLFEWEEPQIEQLMCDLYNGFSYKRSEPYYIGLLTTYNNDLVDGQQRFIVLILMGIAFKWYKFLKVNDEPKYRLTFFARKNDENYLKEKIDQSINSNMTISEYKNVRMENGIKYIKEFVTKNNLNNEFLDYIFDKLTFFISKLPEKYQPQDLNQYFESMNSDGKGLENHEILKVDLLKKVSVEKQIEYTRIWNAVSDMDKPLIRPKYENRVQEEKKKMVDRQLSALQNIDNTVIAFSYCNDINKSNEDTSGFLTIKNIQPKNEPPKSKIRSFGERSILNFSEFLLQVLWLQLTEKERQNPTLFFNVNKLQETFKAHLQAERVELFFENLLKYRILFDYFIIRISTKEDNTTNYTIAFNEDDEDSYRRKLIQYQSMLYVSTTTYLWLTELLQELANKQINYTAQSIYEKLVDFDNVRHQLDENSLSYGKIDRYWFWRLDYYLWENRENLYNSDYLKEDQLNVVEKYTFKPNRSIEHLHPQTSEVPWDEDDLHSFGNLAMISPEFNSTQSNDDVKLKFARVETQIEGKNNLESIKLLLMYNKGEGRNWNQIFAKEHGDKMIEILKNSYPHKN